MEATPGNSIFDFETLFSEFQEWLNGSGLTIYDIDTSPELFVCLTIYENTETCPPRYHMPARSRQWRTTQLFGRLPTCSVRNHEWHLVHCIDGCIYYKVELQKESEDTLMLHFFVLFYFDSTMSVEFFLRTDSGYPRDCLNAHSVHTASAPIPSFLFLFSWYPIGRNH